MNFSILDGVLILLATAVVIVILFRRANLPPILGYLFVGIAVGPHGMGWFPESEGTSELAEFGVVFLMFTIGLEFSLPKLISMRNKVFGLGGLQVILTTILTTIIAKLFGIPTSEAVVIGAILAMSSTAIVIKQLTDQMEFNTPHGESSLGILLFQDLAVIPLLILIPSLSGDASTPILMPLIWASIKGVGALLIILSFGRWILRPVFHEIASSRSMELFTISVLLITLSAAWLTQDLGLSLALGAFLAGMMLGETEFRHQVEANIRPFRDVLLGLFFISIGMLLNLEEIPQYWGWIIFVVVSLIVVKTSIIFSISRLMKTNKFTALRTAMVLAHGGEFGFALLSLAIGQKLLSPQIGQIILGSLVFSMALSPIIIRFNGKIAELVFPEIHRADSEETQRTVQQAAEGLSEHVIICGYGRVGQNIARMLEKEGLHYLALDLDPKRVQSAQLAGDTVTYGDSTLLELLLASGLKHAKALVVSFEDTHSAFKILQQVRKYRAHMPILVRSKSDSELEKLQEHGATEVIPEILEASLALTSHILLYMGIPASRVFRLTRTARSNRYKLLRQVFADQDSVTFNDIDKNKEALLPVSIPENSELIGSKLAELEFEKHDVSITAIRRDGIRGIEPEPDTEIRANDVLVLCGCQSSLEYAEKVLLES